MKQLVKELKEQEETSTEACKVRTGRVVIVYEDEKGWKTVVRDLMKEFQNTASKESQVENVAELKDDMMYDVRR